MASSLVRLIGVPLDLGAGRRGVDMGPSAMRIAGARKSLERLGYEVIDDGDIAVICPARAESGKLRSFELAEVNPVLDIRNSTAEVAVEIMASALVKRII